MGASEPIDVRNVRQLLGGSDIRRDGLAAGRRAGGGPPQGDELDHMLGEDLKCGSVDGEDEVMKFINMDMYVRELRWDKKACFGKLCW